MRKKLILSLLLLVLFCFVVGCDQATPENAESKGDKFFYDESTGKVYTDLSKNFDFKIEKWKYYYDDESSRDRILLSITIKNKSGQRMDSFLGVVSLNKDAADLIASGVLVYDKNEPYDLVPDKTANGVSYSFDLLAERDEWLKEINADKDMLLDKIRYLTLELKWKGGEETIKLVCDKLNDS